MKLLVKKGTTSKRIEIFIPDSSSATGAGLTGLVYNSAGLSWYYSREDQGNAGGSSVTLATMTRGTFASGGFVEKDATNLPGVYQIGVPDAVLASGAGWAVMMLKGATNMAPVPIEIQLVDFDPNDAVRLGLTALPNANAEAVGGLYTRGTGAGQIAQDANGSVRVNVDTIKTNPVVNGGTITFPTNATLASTTNVTSASGVSLAADQEVNVTKVNGTTQTARDLGAQLDATVSSRLAPTVAGRTLDVSSTGEAGVDWANVGSPTSAVNLSGTNISTSQAVASVSGSVTVGTNNDKTGYALSSAGVQAIWDALTSALTTVGSIGKKIVDNLDAAISSRSSHTAADVWASGTRTLTSFGTLVSDIWSNGTRTLTALGSSLVAEIWNALTSGMVTVGSVGKRIADYIDATISSRLASASYTAPDNTSVTAIKTKTDQLVFTTPNRVDASASVSLTPEDIASIADGVAEGASPTIWAYASRTLTQPTAEIENIINSSNDIAARRGDRWYISLTNIGNITSRTKLYFTIKNSKSDTDAQSLVQITETGGLIVFKGAAVTSETSHGSITVTDASVGNVTIILEAAKSSLLNVASGLAYDIQAITASGYPSTLIEGKFEVVADVTRAVS